MSMIKIIATLSIFPILSACGYKEFCDLAGPIPGFDADVAAIVVERNRDTAVAIDTHNRTGEAICQGWNTQKE